MAENLKRLRAFLSYWFIVIVPPWWCSRFAYWILPWVGEHAYREDYDTRLTRIYDHVCPGDGKWVRDCIASGECGCDNNQQAAAPRSPVVTQPSNAAAVVP